MIEIEMRGLKEITGALKRAGEDIQRKIPAVMRCAVRVVKREAKERAPVDTGRLRSSITSEVRGVALETVGVVGSNVEYAPYMELGTKPHWPPYGPGTPLARWAYLHKTDAFVVARAIAARGIKARRYLQGAFEEKKREIIQMFFDLVNGLQV